jgi:general secretion pathway protein N
MIRMGRRGWSLLAIVFLVTLIVTAPATLLAKIVDLSSNGQIVLANATGTVWQGSALPAIRQPSGTLQSLEKLHWDFALWPILTGKVVARLYWGEEMQGQPMEATLSLGQIKFQHVLIPLQAAMIGELVPMLKPVQLSGKIILHSEVITFATQGINGNAIAEWVNAGSVLSAVNPLGNYNISLTGTGERIDIVLMTASGALLLEGNGSFTRAQGLKFVATARATAESKASLDELLNNLGPESAPGVHTLSLLR